MLKLRKIENLLKLNVGISLRALSLKRTFVITSFNDKKYQLKSPYEAACTGFAQFDVFLCQHALNIIPV